MSSSSASRLNLIDSVVSCPQTEGAATDYSMNICCSHSICLFISVIRCSLSSCRSSVFAFLFSLPFPTFVFLRDFLVVALSVLSDLSLLVFPVLDHDSDHLCDAGELRQGATRSHLTLGRGPDLGMSVHSVAAAQISRREQSIIRVE